ncbi:MAG: hypothetical protein OXI53_05320 [Nitrospira sp.]|nr:hypothetical protein [Nitrospira sp.]MDE0505644.1 hypothetical protein [Candidatus Poribacteria bacterium]
MTSEAVERWYPYALGLVITIFYFCFHQVLDATSTAKALFPVVTSISAIAVGFLMTAQSIILSIDQRSVIKGLKQGGVYGHLVGYVVEAARWSFATTIVTGAGMVLSLHVNVSDSMLSVIFTGAWIFITTTAAMCCYRVIRIFSKILRQLAKGES